MKELAESYIKFYEGLNKWVRFVLNFLWAIPTNLYRVAKSLKRNDTVGAVIGAILLVFCGWKITTSKPKTSTRKKPKPKMPTKEIPTPTKSTDGYGKNTMKKTCRTASLLFIFFR